MGRPITREDIRHPFHWLALGFGAGLAKKAPGTWGSVVGAILFAPAMLLPLWCYALLVLVVAVAGIYICDKTARDWGVGDHGAIVWDEVAGMGIALFALPLTISSVMMAFAAFRLFDIWKPWPVGALDRSLRGGFGIMMDDLAAGVLAALLCHFVFWVL